jgi:hypothetical protein
MNAAKIEELIALTTKLAILVEQDVATLKGNRPSALAQNEGDRAALLLIYGKAVTDARAPGAMGDVPASVKARLKAATERLQNALKEQGRLLTRFRHVTEGLVRAVAENVAAREAAPVYAKTGHMVKPPAAPRVSAMTLNQAV